MVKKLFPQGKLKDSLARSAKNWKTWTLVAIYFTTFGGFIALTSWLPTYWHEFFGKPAVTAGVLTAAYSITASLMRVFGGRLADKIGGEKSTLVALAVMLVGAVAMAFSYNFTLSFAAVILMALGMGFGNASVFKLVPQYVPQAVGGASGWVGGLGAFGGFTMPPVLGAIVSSRGAAGYPGGFTLFIVLSFIAIGLACLLIRANKPVPVPQTAIKETP